MNAKKPRFYCAAGCGRRTNTSVARYCSVRCQQVEEHRCRVELLEAGCYPPSQWSTQFIRRYLIERFGEKCSGCGWAERHPVTGRFMVEVEHIDGDWRNTRPENLTLLCPNCHSLTPTFKALNKGRGRPGRHRRERQGASGYRQERRVLRGERKGGPQLELIPTANAPT
jgi:5-methylcytosine-specific restriction endonuclease McrA